MEINERFNKFDHLDDDIEDLNRNGEYSQIINEFEPKDTRYDDDAYELAECGNYELSEDILTEGNEKIKNMTIMKSLGLGGDYSETGSEKGWLLNFLLPKMYMRAKKDWIDIDDNGDVYFLDSKGNRYPTTVTWAKQNGITLNKEDKYINQRDKQTIISYIGYKLFGLALGIKNKFEKDKRFEGWDKQGLGNKQAKKFQAFIEDKLKSYLKKNLDTLRDEAIREVPNGPERANAGKMGTYGNNNREEYKKIGIDVLERVCKTAYSLGHAYGEVVSQFDGEQTLNDSFMKVLVAGYINKKDLVILDNVRDSGSRIASYFKILEDTDDFCYLTRNVTPPTKSKEAKRIPVRPEDKKFTKQAQYDSSLVLAVSYYSFTDINRLQKNEKTDFMNLWRVIVGANLKHDSNSIVPVPFSVMYGNTYKMSSPDYRDKYGYDNHNAIELDNTFNKIEQGGWQGLYEIVVGVQSQSGYGFRNATSGKSNRDARNQDAYPGKDTTVNQQVQIISPDYDRIDDMDVEFQLSNDAEPQYG